MQSADFFVLPGTITLIYDYNYATKRRALDRGANSLNRLQYIFALYDLST